MPNPPADDFLNEEETVRDLLRQVEQARAILEDLKLQATGTRRRMDFDDSAYLVAINEQLVVSALQSQTNAEAAAHALSELSKSFGLDPLTQLPNRVQFHERFSYAIASAQRHRTCVAVLFADIDGFKDINDTLGHAVGDVVLMHAADCIANTVRDVDFVFRFGGDEFVILITDVAQASDAALVAQKIESAVASPITLDNRTLSVSLSIGFCIYPDDGLAADALIRGADAAMYKAKRSKASSSARSRPDFPELPSDKNECNDA